MGFFARLALIMITLAIGAAEPGVAASSVAPAKVHPGDDLAKRRAVAEGHLKFLYTMYFAVKGCTEAAAEFSQPEFLPPVSLEEVRRFTASADAAAREVGVDVDRAWIVASRSARPPAKP